MPFNKARHRTSLYITAMVLIGYIAGNSIYQKSIKPTNPAWTTSIAAQPAWLANTTERITSVVYTPMIDLNPATQLNVEPKESYTQIAESKSAEPLIRYLRATYNVEADDAIVILASVLKYSNAQELPPELVLSVIAKESGFNADAKSSMGARGLMQIIPFWHGEKIKKAGGTTELLWEPDFNIKIGTRILKEYIGLSKGNIYNALARYNGSLGLHNGYPEKILAAKNKYSVYVSKLDT